MGWTPPESTSERLKRRLVPPRLYIRYLYRRALRTGEPELRLLPHLVDRGRAALDVGANKGVYAFALLRCGVRRVHAFEPNPKAFRVLESWARGRATLHPAALGDAAGRAELRVPRTRRGYSNQGGTLSPTKAAGRDCGIVAVDAVRLDDLGIADVGFVKIDVEGFEREVLRGAAATLARDRPTLLVEIEEAHTGRRLDDDVAEICAYGYDCFALAAGVLTPFRRLDLDRHHREVAAPGDYVFNFLFFPR